MSNKKPTLYLSIDIETDGPTPRKNSMLSIGVAGFLESGQLLGTFEANLDPFPGASPDPRTMEEFWSKFPDQYKRTREHTISPADAMHSLIEWLYTWRQEYNLVWVAYPVVFDVGFLNSYIYEFIDNPPRIPAIDLRSFVMGKLGVQYNKTSKRHWPSSWFNSDFQHTHCALDDAIEQGYLFVNMLLMD